MLARLPRHRPCRGDRRAGGPAPAWWPDAGGDAADDDHVSAVAGALELFARLQPDPAAIVDDMRAAGLQADLSYESFPLTFTREKWLSMVRDRYMSLLSSFDDTQIEAGVAEIRQAHPGDQVEFADTFAFVLGTAA